MYFTNNYVKEQFTFIFGACELALYFIMYLVFYIILYSVYVHQMVISAFVCISKIKFIPSGIWL